MNFTVIDLSNVTPNDSFNHGQFAVNELSSSIGQLFTTEGLVKERVLSVNVSTILGFFGDLAARIWLFLKETDQSEICNKCACQEERGRFFVLSYQSKG